MARRFELILRSHRPDAPGRVPAPLRPLAAALAGSAPITVRSGPASRRALRAVGKRAATTGRTIHLDRPADHVPAEILAHELVHVGRPAPEPRFFDDERHTEEEHLARHVGALAKRLAVTDAPSVLARSAVADLAVGGPELFAAEGARARSEAATTLRRRPAGGPPTSSGGAGPGSGSRVERLRRLADGSSSRGDQGRSIAGSFQGVGGSTISRPALESAPVAPAAEAEPVEPRVEQSADEIDPDTLQWIVEQVERRVVEELERRGLPYNPGVL